MPQQKLQSAQIQPRYAKGRISSFGINSVYPRVPWVAAWWSAAFPGLGHMFVGKYLNGLALIIWELVVNTRANLNLGIALSFQGRFDEAKAQINQDWVLLYAAVFVFSIWDSYRCAVEINKSHMLSEIEDAPIPPSDVSFFDVVILDKKNPWVGMAWSMLSPGLGQLYGGSTVIGAFLLAWWIFICYQSQAVRVFLYSFLGDFGAASAIVDWQWFLFLPSIYGYAVYQAYSSVNESNILYDVEQIRFLRMRAASLEQQDTAENGAVQIIATFEHSPLLEVAIHEIEKLGVPPRDVVALPLENLDSTGHIIDSIHRVDGRSILDGAMVSSTVFMVLGTIYGFVWHWGPVVWGLIGFGGGFFFGLAIELALYKKKLKIYADRKSEVILRTTCVAALQDRVIDVLRTRKASGFLIVPQQKN